LYYAVVIAFTSITMDNTEYQRWMDNIYKMLEKQHKQYCFIYIMGGVLHDVKILVER
jgi:hypothetical protein